MNNNHPEVFRFYNNVFTKNPDKKIINNLFLWNKKITKEKYEILSNIILQLNEIKASLEPLINLGIVFDLWLIGGSVRDFLLNNEKNIKDLDVMIKINSKNKIYLPKLEVFFKKTNFKVEQEKLKELSYRKSNKEFSWWKHTNKIYKKYKLNEKEKKIKEEVYFDMFVLALGQNFKIEEFYPPKEKKISEVDTYLDLRLKSVIKINKDNWKWPVDILITDYSVDGFLSGFDIGICEAAFEFVRKEDLLKQINNSPKNPEELLKLGYITNCFLTDFHNKELKLRIFEGMQLRQLINSLESHIPRLEKKYNWKIVINYMEKDFTEDFDWEKKEELESLLKKDKKGMIAMIKNYFLLRKIKNNLDEKSILITHQKNEKKMKI